MLDRVLKKKDGSGLRGAEMVLLHSWEIALTVLEALENGRDPVEDAVNKSAKPGGGVENKLTLLHFISKDSQKQRITAKFNKMSNHHQYHISAIRHLSSLKIQLHQAPSGPVHTRKTLQVFRIYKTV